MDLATKECTCGEICCCAVPAEFVRMRYFFGQRLGVVDLSDQQGYHAGKQRFHNLRAHGVGVLCGLKAERFVFPQGAPADSPATLLRVIRGAALDGCGREVVVGADQCIDVAAWFLKNLLRAEVASVLAKLEAPVADDVTPPPRIGLWVALRYRECPSQPTLAPRDPCGCDDDGCEYGRIREGFELALLTEEEARCAHETFPLRSDLEETLLEAGAPGLGDATPRSGLARALKALLAESCAAVEWDEWLCLARFDAWLTRDSATGWQITDISTPDNALPQRGFLLTTAALQELLLGVAGNAAEEGALGPGPRLGKVTFASSSTNGGTLGLAVELATDEPTGVVELAAASFDPSSVKVHAFDPVAGTWKDRTPAAASVTYEATPEPRFKIEWTGAAASGGAVAAGLHRLTLNPPFETPVVDERMQSLRPTRSARHFRLELDPSGTFLTLAKHLF